MSVISIITNNDTIDGASVSTPDYRNFKTPFFEIGVGLPNTPPSEIKPLPTQIHKLIQKVEIVENLENSSGHLIISLTILEGSREPFNRSSGTDAHLYQGGDFSNHSGFVVDTKFENGSSGVGLTSLINGAISAATDQLTAGASASEGLGGSSSTKEEEAKDSEEVINTEVPIYLFSPSSRLKIRWGYLEDIENQRIIMADILTLRTSFPENSQPMTEVVAKGPSYSFDMFTPTKGIQYKVPDSLTPSALGSIEEKDKDVEDILDEIAEKAGFDLIRSEDFDANEQTISRITFWPVGQSLNQFLTGLAKKHNAYYTSYYNMSNGKPTVYFVRREEFDSFSNFDNNLLNYKSPGSILKSINVTADFGAITNTGLAGLRRKEGAVIRGLSNNSNKKIALKLFGKTVAATNTSKGSHANKAGEGINKLTKDNLTGNISYTPEDRLEHVKELATNTNFAHMSKTVTVDFTTMGFTNLKPGVVTFSGIGDRYSGKYTIMNITHTIDNTGYVCKGTATGASIKTGGVEVPNSGKDAKTEKKVSLKLFDELTKGK